jgi:hypothetical protein
MTTKTKNLEKIKKKTFGLTEKLEHSSLKDLINWNTTKRPKKKGRPEKKGVFVSGAFVGKALRGRTTT